MNEKELIDLWNVKRSQITKAQLAPSLVLIAILVTAAFGKFADASDGARYLAIGVAAATGVLAVITQYAAIREAEAMLNDFNKLATKSKLAEKISESRSFLSLTAIAIVGISLAVFALIVWAVLGS